jgi:hypothetical protein
LRREIVGGEVEPARESPALGERAGLAGQSEEDCLRHILGGVGVAPDFSQGHGVHEIDVAAHEFGEGRVGAFRGVLKEQFGVIHHDRSSYSCRRAERPNKKGDSPAEAAGRRADARGCLWPGN